MVDDAELRTIAERLTAPIATYSQGEVPVYLGHTEPTGAVSELARAYLRDHPADDAEPVTLEWAKTLTGGAEYPDYESPGDGRRNVLFWDGNWVLAVAVFAAEPPRIGVLDGECAALPHVKTRGDFRRLLKCLGIDPKEPS